VTLRILWASDHPAATSGYSVQTALAVPRLQRAGLAEMAILATYGQHGYRAAWEGIPVYPGGADAFANDVIGQSARDWRADAVVTLKDSFVFKPEALQGQRWCPLIPIDHEPAPPAVVNVARAAYAPIAYAPNGVRALRAVGLDPLYAPHGYDPAVFYPEDKAAARAALGLPLDRFIVGTVAVNRGGLPSRKAWAELIEGVGLFRQHARDALYIAHTYAGDDGFEGSLPLRQLAHEAGIADVMVLPHVEAYRAGFPAEHLRHLYNAIDVLLCVSLGEGFGLPTLEAQACGTPVIASRWAAQEDLIFSGWGLDRAEARRFRDGQMTYVYIPSPHAIAARLGEAYQAWADGQGAALRAKALDGAAPYQIDRIVAEHWAPLLRGLEARIAREQRQPRGVMRVVRPEEVLGV
jgi:glycosyltransferase involved in cell wall biosynthesis